ILRADPEPLAPATRAPATRAPATTAPGTAAAPDGGRPAAAPDQRPATTTAAGPERTPDSGRPAAAPRPPPATPAPGRPHGPPEARVRPAPLPAALSAFTGRRDELARALALLPDRPSAPPAVAVCTISGTAGVGKTTLAVHWAHQVRDRYPD